MDFKKLGQQVGQIQKTAKDKLGDRAEPDNLKKDAKEFREILAGDGSLADKAKEAKQRLGDQPRERAEGEKPKQDVSEPASDPPAANPMSNEVPPPPEGNEPGTAP